MPIYQNAAHEEKGMKQTALHFAATSGDEDVVETLLKANVNAQARDEHGETALHKAVKAGQKQIVEVLLKAGGDPSPGDKDGNTPLHQAAFFGSTEIIQLLLAFGADCLAKNKDGERPTDKAEYGYRVARKGLSGIANGDIQVTGTDDRLCDGGGALSRHIEHLAESSGGQRYKNSRNRSGGGLD